jgi:uncharacterized protein (TIGR02271 family)
MSSNGDAAVTRHEQELQVGTTTDTAGTLRVRKHVDAEHVSEVHQRSIEDADVERVRVGEEDSGQIETLADGSISVPIFEERLVVTKQRFVRERVIVRKNTTTREHVVEAELLKERVDIEHDGDVD